ncbi:hypothetical protein GMMP15_390064 [Candidatus Magnetomoraceae bacterium gMMP-15]
MSEIFYTETLAKIYADQGVFDKAFEAYQFLTERYPEKSELKEALEYAEQNLSEQLEMEEEKLSEDIHEIPEAEEVSVDFEAAEPSQQEITYEEEQEEPTEPKSAIDQLKPKFRQWFELLLVQRNINQLKNIQSI